MSRPGRPTEVTNLDPRIRRILPHLSSTGKVEEIEGPADILIHSHPNPSLLQTQYPHPIPSIVLDWGVVYERPFFKTRIATWSPNQSRLIAIQLVSRYVEDKKSCSPEHQTHFAQKMTTAGYEFVPLGLPASIEETIRIAARAQAFVGVCSGMSHLCHSVGIPVHLIRNGQDPDTLAICHRGNPYEVYKDVFEFVDRFCAVPYFPPGFGGSAGYALDWNSFIQEFYQSTDVDPLATVPGPDGLMYEDPGSMYGQNIPLFIRRPHSGQYHEANPTVC